MKKRNAIGLCICLTVSIFACQESRTDKFNLEGVWVIYNYKPGKICAMDDSTATQWIGKKAFFKERLCFEYSKIHKYKDEFKNDSICDYITGQKRELVSTIDYFNEYYRASPNDFEINQKEILLIHTNCKGTPFEDIMVLSNNEIRLLWDGIMFFMKREK